MSPTSTDQILFARAFQFPHRESFARALHPRVRAIATRLLRGAAREDPHLADTVANDVLLLLWRKRQQLRHPDRAFWWSFIVIQNEVNRAFRRAAADRHDLTFDDDRVPEHVRERRLADRGYVSRPAPLSRHVATTHLRDRVLANPALPPRQRRLFSLYLETQLTQHELARATGYCETSVPVILSVLRSLLDDSWVAELHALMTASLAEAC